MNEIFTAIPWIILFLPLLAAVAITFFTQRQHGLSAGLSIGAVAVSFLLSLILLGKHSGETLPDISFTWLAVGDLQIEMGIKMDALSQLMLLIVTGVGSVIHIYSWGYMRGDRGVPRYFACLSLFTFSMLGIVLANNFVQMFIFWELVGVSSYLLIGFWFERPSAADAGKKAFITTRLGDFGFLLGIIMLWALAGSVNFNSVEGVLSENPAALGGMATIVGLLIFCGAVGKSAQFPLHVWLPDAMEGPTPVSALIHAATMVAAGVYMLCRVFFIFNMPALEVIAWVGGFTALLAALIAVQQNDIKRILAYSTLSQLGLMVMAVGVSGASRDPSPAMYHLTTHAFFKALLFLGAGSVIHAVHDQDIWKMGGVRQKMPITYGTFLIGTLALAGAPLFSGFYSKDEILAQAYHHSPALFIVGVLVSFLTTFYMFRLVFVAFLGAPKSDSAAHAHESPGVMTYPLLALAVPSILAGYWGIHHFIQGAFPAAPQVHAVPWHEQMFAPFSHAPVAALFGLLAVALGFGMALQTYRKATRDPLPEQFGILARAMQRKFYFDEIYAVLNGITHEALARLADAFDRWIISGLIVRGTHGATELFGRALRMAQTGNLQVYAFLFTAGVILLLYVALVR